VSAAARPVDNRAFERDRVRGSARLARTVLRPAAYDGQPLGPDVRSPAPPARSKRPKRQQIVRQGSNGASRSQPISKRASAQASSPPPGRRRATRSQKALSSSSCSPGPSSAASDARWRRLTRPSTLRPPSGPTRRARLRIPPARTAGARSGSGGSGCARSTPAAGPSAPGRRPGGRAHSAPRRLPRRLLEARQPGSRLGSGTGRRRAPAGSSRGRAPRRAPGDDGRRAVPLVERALQIGIRASKWAGSNPNSLRSANTAARNVPMAASARAWGSDGGFISPCSLRYTSSASQSASAEAAGP